MAESKHIRKLRLVIASRVTLFHSLGGLERHTRDVAEGLANRGHEVTVLTTAHKEGLKEITENGVNYHFFNNAVSSRYSAEYTAELVNVIPALKPDVLISEQSSLAGYIVQVDSEKRPQILAIMHGTNFTDAQSVLMQYSRLKRQYIYWRYMAKEHRAFGLVNKRFLARAEVIATVSPFVANAIQHQYKINRDKITIIPNGVDLTLCRKDLTARQAIRKTYGIDDNAIVLLCIGRLTIDKGFGLALKAYRKLNVQYPNTRLLIVGDGEERVQLEKLAEDFSPGQIIFTGSQPQADTSKFYSASDILLLPSLRLEGLPYTIAEAAAHAMAIISTDHGGQGGEIQHGVNGLTFKAGNIQQCSSNMELLLKDAETRTRLAEASYQTALKRYDINRMIDKYEDQIYRLVENQRKGNVK